MDNEWKRHDSYLQILMLKSKKEDMQKLGKARNKMKDPK